MKNYVLLILILIAISCGERFEEKTKTIAPKTNFKVQGVSLVVLGTLQDAGSPHIACKKDCCAGLFENPDASRKVVSLGLIDHDNQQSFLFDATPDIASQLKMLRKQAHWEAPELPNGIFLTHAHVGHYSGLMYLGKEATNADSIPTYVMPNMKRFLEQNGPWSQLVSEKNIVLNALENETATTLSTHLKVIPLQVPHRDEFSETVGFKILGPNKSALFIPDIDKWDKWETDISALIQTVDYAFLDASFYDGDELNTRDISQIPHPFVIESMSLFEALPAIEKKKIHFIHFNHTNALLNPESEQTLHVKQKGFNIAQFNTVFTL